MTCGTCDVTIPDDEVPARDTHDRAICETCAVFALEERTRERYVTIQASGGETIKISPEDLWWAGGRSWHIDSVGYPARNEGGRAVRLHALVAKTRTGHHTDHINGDKLDNRRENVRSVTPHENQLNRKKINRNNTSGHAGVWRGKYGWVAQVTVDHKTVIVGHFKTIEEAVAARAKAQRERIVAAAKTRREKERAEIIDQFQGVLEREIRPRMGH